MSPVTDTTMVQMAEVVPSTEQIGVPNLVGSRTYQHATRHELQFFKTSHIGHREGSTRIQLLYVLQCTASPENMHNRWHLRSRRS